jgi:uroporphyrinogen-III decarboxylase
MGVDILNPLEPPKNGDIDLEAAIAKYQNRIGWEGNIEIQEILQASPERLKELIEKCVDAGSKSGRFILCPSAGYMEYPFPDERYISNLLLYLEYGYECVERCRKN